MDNTTKVLLILLVVGVIGWFLFFRKSPVPVQPRVNPSIYKWKGKTLKNENELYCGFFGKRVIKSKKNGVVTLGCECEPVEIENGSFDKGTWDYTCNEGYHKWFDLNTKRKYRTTPGLRNDISLRELYAKKPIDEPYCVN